MTIGCVFSTSAEVKTSKNGKAYLCLSVKAGDGDTAE
jgi:hypothetical protein